MKWNECSRSRGARKEAGITVHYCAEQFENDGSLSSTLIKSMKRAMAGEYTRHAPAPQPVAPSDRDATTFYQVFIKIDPQEACSAKVDRALETELKVLKEKGLKDWLGGRDLNPDNVVQSHVSYR